MNVRRLSTIVLFVAALGAGAQEKSAGRVAVAFDGNSNALLRWALPDGPLPVDGFLVERVSGGSRERVALVQPGDATNAPGLAAEKREAAAEYLANAPKLAGVKAEDADQARLPIEMLTIIDPQFAAFLGLGATDRNAPRGANVAYVVSALSSDGRSVPYATSGTVAVMPTPLPQPPGELRSDVTRQGIALFWTAARRSTGDPAAAIAYEVRRGRTLITPQPVMKAAGDSENPGAIDEKPEVETKNAYTVVAIDLFGRRSAESRPLEVFFPDYAALDPPADVVATSERGQVQVKWAATPNTNRKGWRVMRARQPQSVGEAIAQDLVTGATFMDTAVKPGSVYYYRVTAVNKRNEEGEPAVSSAVRVLGAQPLSPPTQLSAQVKTGRVILTWTASAGAVSGYQVERATTSDWRPLNNQVTTMPRYVDEYPVDATGTFRYRVVTWGCDDSKSAPSEVVTVALPDTKPPLPPLVTKVDGSNGRVTLDFAPGGGAGDASQFVVLRSLSPDDSGVIVNPSVLGTDARRFIDTTVDAGRTYHYRVIAIDAAGNRSAAPMIPTAVRVAAPPLPAAPVPRLRFETKPFRRVVAEFNASGDPSVLYALERRDASGWTMIAGPFPPDATKAFDTKPPRGRATYRLVTLGADASVGAASAEVTIEVK